jgi:regulator of RNase E activity RraB
MLPLPSSRWPSVRSQRAPFPPGSEQQVYRVGQSPPWLRTPGPTAIASSPRIGGLRSAIHEKLRASIEAFSIGHSGRVRDVMSEQWEPDFDSYLAEEEGAPVSIVVDLAASEVAPITTHPVLLRMTIPMRAPRPDGLRSDEETEALNAFEDALIERMRKQAGALFVGRYITRGDAHVAFYLPARGPRDPAQLKALARDLKPYTFECELDEDPEWEFYLENLYPDVYSERAIMNRRQLAVMARQGDDPHALRTVDHLAFFPSKKQARDAATALQAAGFDTDEPHRESQGEEPCWAVGFHRDEALEAERMNAVTTEVLDIVLEQEGEYDGWGAEVMSEDSTPSE